MSTSQKSDASKFGKLAHPPAKDNVPIPKGRNVNLIVPKHRHEELNLAEKRREARLNAEKRAQFRTAAKRQQTAERIAAATEELASGISQANAAAEQLSLAMSIISSSALESGAACQEGQLAADEIAKGALKTTDAASASLRKVDTLKEMVRNVSKDIEKLVFFVAAAAEKNVESAKMIADLEKKATDIGDVVKAVATIADQTNLLALNAAIEAARAGEHGRGFAVVADEVRGLAETAEKSASQIRELIAGIQKDVTVIAKATEKSGITAKEEVEKGKEISKHLIQMEQEMKGFSRSVQDVEQSAQENAAAIEQFRRGAETIANAAEESSSAANEASTAANEQQKSLREIENSTDELAQMAEDLKSNTSAEKSSEALAASSEQLSATIQEANTSAQQIMTAIREILKGNEQQSSATLESSAAIKEIEKNIVRIGERSKRAIDLTGKLQNILNDNKNKVEQLISGVNKASHSSKLSAENVTILEKRVCQVDKIVDQITAMALKTSMLAVNGGIEAARSGDFGKGFAVVAGDIRSLATESQTNAEKIKELIEGIRLQIQIAAKDVLEVGITAENEVLSAKKVTENLLIIESEMNLMEQGIKGIDVVCQASIVAVQQAVKGVQQIASAAEQAASAVHQASTSADEQGKGMQELAQAVEEISAMADELQIKN